MGSDPGHMISSDVRLDKVGWFTDQPKGDELFIPLVGLGALRGHRSALHQTYDHVQTLCGQYIPVADARVYADLSGRACIRCKDVAERVYHAVDVLTDESEFVEFGFDAPLEPKPWGDRIRYRKDVLVGRLLTLSWRDLCLSAFCLGVALGIFLGWRFA